MVDLASPTTPPRQEGAPSAAPAGKQEAWDRAIARGECLHCGSSVGDAWVEAEGPFCCRGCRTVFLLLHDEGLDRFYDIARGRQAPPAQLEADAFGWLDHMLASTPAGPGGELRLALDIQGVHCAACVWLLERLFDRYPAGLELRINPSLGKVDLAWNPTRGDLREYLAAAEKFGYRFAPSRKVAPERSRDRTSQ